MPLLYFPGCKYTAHNPVASQKIQNYVAKNYQAQIAACCSIDYKKPTPGQTCVYVCPTCAGILRESAPQAKVISIWELLQNDHKFPWPDYQNEEISLQDCWRSFDDNNLHQAIRQVLKNCNIKVIEGADNREKSRFCGLSLLKPPSPRYHKLAPKRFIQRGADIFTPCSEEEQLKKMQEHCRHFKTETVICYCTGCLEGLQKGGKTAVHLMDILTSRL